MPKDYKHSSPAKGRGKPKSRLSRWTSIAVLALLATAMAATIILRDRQEATRDSIQPKKPPESKAKGSEERSEGPRFDFYKMLPKMEVRITEDELEAAQNELPKVERSGNYILQAGSFVDYADADRLKAQLALIGVEARIESVVINDERIWYRVRMGPYASFADLKRVRNRLKKQDIEFMVVKLEL